MLYENDSKMTSSASNKEELPLDVLVKTKMAFSLLSLAPPTPDHGLKKGHFILFSLSLNLEQTV